jgi:hypothetical protein
MKRYLLIFLAFQILVTSSPGNLCVQEFFKMGTFFHHYAHHILCDQENIGIVEFVQLHYTDNAHYQNDFGEHQNLPFHQDQHSKTHDHQNLSPQTPCVLPQYYAIEVYTKLEIISNPLISFAQQGHHSLFAGDIWQPPKA